MRQDKTGQTIELCVLIKAIKRDYSQFSQPQTRKAINGYIKGRQYRYVSIEGTDMVIKEVGLMIIYQTANLRQAAVI